MTFDEQDVFFNINEDEARLTITVKGALHVGQRKYFESGLNHIESPLKTCEVDLSDATHFDSAAVSMLLVLKDHECCKDCNFIINASKNTTIQKILQLHCLDKIFTIVN